MKILATEVITVDNNFDFSFLTWLLPSIISILAILRSYNKDIKDIFARKQEIEDEADTTNFDQVARLRDMHLEECQILLDKIEKEKKEKEELDAEHKLEMQIARKAYEELGRFKIEFDELKRELEWHKNAYMITRNQLIENKITPLVDDTKGT